MNRVYIEKTGLPVALYYVLGLAYIPVMVIVISNLYSQVDLNSAAQSQSSNDFVLISTSIFVLVLSFGILWLMISMKLELRIADNRLSFRFPPFVIKERIYAFNEIEQLDIIKKSRFLTGLGLRYDPSRKTRIYSTGSDHVLSIQLQSGKNFMLSTRNPDELRRIIELTQNNDYE